MQQRRVVKYDALMLGFLAMGLQLELMRQFLSVCRGNELSIGLLLGIWLTWIAIGAFFANIICVKKKTPLFRFTGLFILTLYLGLCSLIGIKYMRVIMNVAVGEFVPLFSLGVYAAVFMSIPCLLCGAMFTLLTLHAMENSLPGEPAGFVYVFESLGSFIAGFMVTVLTPHTTPLSLFLLIGFIASISTLVINHKSWIAVLNLVMVLLLLLASPSLDAKMNRDYWQSFDDAFTLMDQDYTQYGEAAIVKWSDQLFYYFNGVKQTALVDSIEAQQLAALCMTQHPDPQRLCIIGGAMGGMPTAGSRFPVSTIDVLEIDKQAIELARKYLPKNEQRVWTSERVHLLYTDSRHFFRYSASKYDMILINMGHPATALTNRYYTLQHFNDLKAHLSEGGVLGICSFTAGSNFMGPELTSLNSSIYYTLKQCFKHVITIPGDAAHYFASNRDSVLSINANVLQKRYLGKTQLKYVYPQWFQYVFDQERIHSFKSNLTTFPFYRINTDFHPVAFLYDYLMWYKIEQKDSLNLKFLLNPPVFIVLSMILFVWLFFVLVLHSRRTAAISIFIIAVIIGYSAMVFDVVLILGFQTLFGNIYSWVGLIVALFMLGSSGASYLMNRYVDRFNMNILFLLLSGLVVYSLFLFVLLTRLSMPSPWLFIPIMLLSGGLTGAAFPVLCRIEYIYSGRHSSKIYTADLLGGMVGAILVSGYFIPILGFTLTLNTVLLLGSASVVILLVIKQYK